MAQVILSAHLQGDFLFEHARQVALEELQASPLIERPVENGKRELVIATGTSGLARSLPILPELDTVFVLGVRSQRELGPGKATP